MADIDLRHLQYFVAAAESRSFVRAAKLVNVSQPAITKSIQRMEKWFGHALFERGAELKLTTFGETLLEDAKRVLGGFDDLLETANHFGRTRAVSLRIGAGPLMAETIVGTAVGRLLVRFPALRTFIHVDNYAVFPAMLRERRIDMFIADISDIRDTSDLEVRQLKASRFNWFCRKGHPLARRKALTLADVLAYPLALPELPPWAREWFAAQLPPQAQSSLAQPPIHPAVICGHYSTLIRAVIESDAVSALTEIVLRTDPYSSRLVELNFIGDTPTSNPGIVTLKKHTLPPVAHMLMDAIADVAEGV